jgi:hypothetical protein
MANEGNLLTPEQRNLTSEEASEMGKLGGKASVEARRHKKQMKELAQMMGNCQPKPEIRKKVKELFPDLKGDEITNKVVMLAKIYEKAAKGDVKAFEVFRDTAGEKPINVNEHSGLDGHPLQPFQVIIEGVEPDNKEE